MIKQSYFNRKNGFTLSEVVVSALLSAIIITVAYNLYIFAKDIWAYVDVKGDLQRKAVLGLERMIHGVDNNHKGIHEAGDAQIPAAGSSGTRIVLVDGQNADVSREFYLSGDDIVYKNEHGVTSVLIQDDVQSITFTRSSDRANLLVINLTLRKDILERTVSVILNTSAEMRNM